MPIDKKLSKLIINRLSQEQYDAIESPSEDELYLTPDESKGGDVTLDGDNAFTGKNSFAKDVTMGGIAKVTLPVKQSGVTALTMDTLAMQGLNPTNASNPFMYFAISGGLNSNSHFQPVIAPIFNSNGEYCRALDEVKSEGYIEYGSINWYQLPNSVSDYIDLGKTDGDGVYFYVARDSGKEFMQVTGLYDSTSISKKVYPAHTKYNVGSESHSVTHMDTGKIFKDLINDTANDYVSASPTIFQKGDGDANFDKMSRFPTDNTASSSSHNYLAFDGDKMLWEPVSATSKTYYRHTVTIAGTRDGSNSCIISFTDECEKNTKIDSYQDLNTCFGGILLTASGMVVASDGTTKQGCLQLDLHGGTITTDKVIVVGANATGVEYKLSDLGTLTFTDDVSKK